jgi:hypothetical protein
MHTFPHMINRFFTKEETDSTEKSLLTSNLVRKVDPDEV